MAVLGAAAWAARRTSAAGLPFGLNAVDHVQLAVSDPAKSAAFYGRIFGFPVWKNNQTPRRYVRLGPSYLVLDTGQAAGRVDHFSTGIRGFDIARLHAYLQQIGVPFRDFPSGRDTSVTDLDGTRLELSGEDSWTQLAKATAAVDPASPSGEAIFKPAGVDHILLNVADQEKSAAFYEKIYGPVTQRNNGRVWFQAGSSRVGLLPTPAGQRAGVNHFCVLAEKFDYDDVLKKLEQAGAKVEIPEIAGAPGFRDPDGALVQVMGPRISQ